MYDEKWRIIIGESRYEVFEFDNLKIMMENLTKILNIKDKFGRIDEKTKS